MASKYIFLTRPYKSKIHGLLIKKITQVSEEVCQGSDGRTRIRIDIPGLLSFKIVASLAQIH